MYVAMYTGSVYKYVVYCDLKHETCICHATTFSLCFPHQVKFLPSCVMFQKLIIELFTVWYVGNQWVHCVLNDAEYADRKVWVTSCN